ncbi:VanZ family protein [Mesobacillus subterraneus]|uniref:VanZ family protein n=1 Tax=Mesobacillus subterraneus TaxID=285983 RepID=UPI001CFD64B2|nr:VanZ family protein [Mesobacillus subterraneus]WLR55430.1 VanZ family protein [Mesobacillus subterraneus]
MRVIINYKLMFGMDKLMHFIGFAGISALIGVFMLIISDRDRVKDQLSVIWFVLVTIGIIEEYRQYLDPVRSSEFFDAIANIFGVTTGVGITLGVSYILASKQEILSNVFRLYPMILIMLLIGLLYFNERPFLIDVSIREQVRSLAALIGF